MLNLPLHPRLVHLPIALAVLLPLLSGGLLVAWWRSWLPKRTWVLVVAAQALLLGSGIAAMRTGSADEERAEAVVSERAIEAHEEAAEVFLWGSGAVLVLALGALLLRAPRVALGAGLATTVGTLAVLGLGYRTGQAGGQLVYGHGAAQAFTSAADVQSQVWGREEEERDD